MDAKDIIKERKSTHGDYTDTTAAMHATKQLWKSEPGWKKLSIVQQEALEMVAHKVARILVGDPNVKDHWDDIAGYATLVSERI